VSKTFDELTQAECEEFAFLQGELQTLHDAPYFSESSWERCEEIMARMWGIISVGDYAPQD
jgi:hypothetical protein